MTVFAVVYFGTALAVTAAVYFMSLNSEKKPALKTVLLIVYILALVGLVFATGCLEAKYGFTRLKSTAKAAPCLYFPINSRHSNPFDCEMYGTV